MKNFDKWNREKKSIETSKGIIFYHTREIWWCSPGINVGLVNGKVAKALISQIKVIDTKRLIRKVGSLNLDLFAEVRKNVKGLL